MMYAPAPGSPEAIAAGCMCKRKRATLVDADTGDNLVDVWMVLVVHNCPLHGQPAPAGETGGGDE